MQFNLVGYGCTTCIGNSGPLPEPVADAVQKGKLTVAAVLSGNRNFEGRINSLVRANYLASPPLVVAYALAGRVDIDLQTEPLGSDQNGKAFSSRTSGHRAKKSRAAVKRSVRAEMFQKQYSEVFQGDERWNSVKVPTGDLYEWSEKSTYIRKPPYFENMVDPATSVQDLVRPPRAGHARRFGHHRSHLARRKHSRRQPGRKIPDRCKASSPAISIPTARAAATTK